MFKFFRTNLTGKAGERGFTLIELLIVVLIVGILSAVAVPLYLGYTQDARLAEGKALTGSIWTAWQASAQQNCGSNMVLSTNTYARAGLSTSGATVPPRWSVSSGGSATLSSACTTGAYAQSASFIVSGTSTDNNQLKVSLLYDSAASPPTVITCSTNNGTSYFPC